MLVLAAAMLLQAGAPPARPGLPDGYRPSVITMPDWMRRPTGEDLARHYPYEAMLVEQEGRAVMRCTVSATGTMQDCGIISETPTGFGFGQTVLQLSPLFTMRPMTRDGVAVSGGVVQIPVSFRLPSVAGEAPLLTQPVWVSRPTAKDLAHVFPGRAPRPGLTARTITACEVSVEGALTACLPLKAEPAGLGFGEAALKLMPKFKMRPVTADGVPVEGRRVNIALNWTLSR